MINQIPANRGLWSDLWQDFEAFSFSAALVGWGNAVQQQVMQRWHTQNVIPQKIKTITWRQTSKSEEKLARCSLRKHSLPNNCQLSKITESVLHISCLHLHIVFFFFVISKTVIALPRIASPAWLYDTICNSLCIIYIISLAHVEAAYQNNNSLLFQSDKEAAERFFTDSAGAEAFIYTYIKNQWLFVWACFHDVVMLNL